MNGQWLGAYTGTNSGSLKIDIDDQGSHFQGLAYFRDDNVEFPWFGAAFRTADRNSPFEFETNSIWTIDPRTGNVLSTEDIKKRLPEFSIPAKAQISGEWDATCLKFDVVTDIGASVSCELPRSRVDQPSDLGAKHMDWKEFKNFVAGLAGSRHLFRGQKNPWRLRTRFHRTGRADLVRFVTEDIQALHRHLSARSRHIFNLSVPAENGAFFNLVQHHGYPTPLLDWTYSPYVAAFFAYREVSRSEAAKAGVDSRVRLFVLDQRYRTEITQLSVANHPAPHFSISEFIAIDNERLVPQQSVSAISNVDDIESYMVWIADRFGGAKPYLTAIDLPTSQRNEVYRELAYMGVTAGSLFPGFDGACEELRERNFL
jgi:FRG domain